MSFDRLRTNGKFLIPFMLGPELIEGSNHGRNPVGQSIPRHRVRHEPAIGGVMAAHPPLTIEFPIKSPRCGEGLHDSKIVSR